MLLLWRCYCLSVLSSESDGDVEVRFTKILNQRGKVKSLKIAEENSVLLTNQWVFTQKRQGKKDVCGHTWRCWRSSGKSCNRHRRNRSRRDFRPFALPLAALDGWRTPSPVSKAPLCPPIGQVLKVLSLEENKGISVYWRLNFRAQIFENKLILEVLRVDFDTVYNYFLPIFENKLILEVLRVDFDNVYN